MRPSVTRPRRWVTRWSMRAPSWQHIFSELLQSACAMNCWVTMRCSSCSTTSPRWHQSWSRTWCRSCCRWRSFCKRAAEPVAAKACLIRDMRTIAETLGGAGDQKSRCRHFDGSWSGLHWPVRLFSKSLVLLKKFPLSVLRARIGTPLADRPWCRRQEKTVQRVSSRALLEQFAERDAVETAREQEVSRPRKRTCW